MPFRTKALWAQAIVDAASLARLDQHLTATGANLLCIRTDSPYIAQLITQLHAKGIGVFGWRWPHARPNDPNNPAGDSVFAPNEMNRVIGLINQGLDGYIFDIESNGDGAPNDWEKPPNRAQVATAMVAGIAQAFKNRNKAYTLGLTSHQRGFSNYPNIPWQPFLDECNALFPQSYWRADKGNGAKACNPASYDYSTHPPHAVGSVDQALHNGFTDYANKKNNNGNVLSIIPVGGEIGCTKLGEMTLFGSLLEKQSVTEAHFYVDVTAPGWNSNTNGADPSVLDEIKKL
jgi:hypothetical protein